MKVKIFKMTADFEKLEKDIEVFADTVESDGYRVKEVKYSTEFTPSAGELYSAMVIYEVVDFFTS
ncbi:MAG: hypothetical protein ACRCWD_07250 [Culicoidibacterales bacterium]